jgi:cell division protein ZipA
MMELRWLILIVGIVFVAVVYLAARRQDRARQRRRRERAEPVVGSAVVGNDDWEIERIEPGLGSSGSDIADDSPEWNLAEQVWPQAGSVTGENVVDEDAARSSAGPDDPAPAAPGVAGAEDLPPPPYLRQDEPADPLPVVREGDGVHAISSSENASVKEPASRRRRREHSRRTADSTAAGRRERHPSREPEQLELDATSSAADQGKATTSEHTEGGTPGFEEVIALRLVPRSQGTFDGDSVAQGLITAGLARGEYDIFHYRPPGADAPVFSVANLVEPGTLREEDLAGQQLRGLTLFLLLPGPMAGSEALREMVASGRLLANYLDADLQDDTGGSLTRQTEELLKEQIVAFEHRRTRSERG